MRRSASAADRAVDVGAARGVQCCRGWRLPRQLRAGGRQQGQARGNDDADALA
jgi:hypothetical protein